MADLELVREEGFDVQTILTVRVTEQAWDGREKTLRVIGHHVHVKGHCQSGPCRPTPS